VKFFVTKVPLYLGEHILRVFDCIVTISFIAYLILWLF
jgi:hypothetical protein